MPELSFGSHFFHDLVETGIFYASIFEDNNTLKFNNDFFHDAKNILSDICSNYSEVSGIIKVFDLSKEDLFLFSDIISGRTICGKTSKKS